MSTAYRKGLKLVLKKYASNCSGYILQQGRIINLRPSNKIHGRSVASSSYPAAYHKFVNADRLPSTMGEEGCSGG